MASIVSLVDITLPSGVRRYCDFETLAFPDYYGKLLGPVTLSAALPDAYYGVPGPRSAQVRLSNVPVRGDTPGLTLSEIRLVDELYRAPVRVRHADAKTGAILQDFGGVVTAIDTLTATEASLTAASYDDALLATPLPRRKLLDLFPDAQTTETDRSVIWPWGVMRRATLTQLWARPLLVTFTLSGTPPYSMHVQLATVPNYVIASGDVFTCDFVMINSDFHASVDLLTTTSNGLTTYNVLDQNSISISTASSLVNHAVGKVYRRRFSVPAALVGQTVNRLSVRITHTIAGTYQVYIAKAQMLDGGGTVRAVLYDEYSLPAAPVVLSESPATNSVTAAPFVAWDFGGIRSPATGTVTCVAVYRESVQLLPSEYTFVGPTSISNLYLLRFTQSQADLSGALPKIQADFVSTEYADNPARVVESLLADTVDGLGEPTAPASFTAAAADYVTTAITSAGGLDKQTKAGDILGGLLFHGALLERDATAAWTLDVDTAAKRTTSSLTFGDGDPAQLDNCTVTSAPPPKLAERIKTLFLDGLRDPGLSEETMLVHTVRKRTIPGVEQTISVPYIGSLDALDREADYLMKRLIMAEQQMQLDVSAIADGAVSTLTRRQRTTLTAPGYFFSNLPVAVRALTADGPTRHAVLEADDATLHTYTPGTEQRADPRAAGVADPSFTTPAVVTNLRVVTSVLSVAADGSKVALTTIAATAPNSNVTHVVFQVHTAGSTDILAERSISANPSQEVRAVFPLQPNVLYDLVAYARNVDNTAAAQDGVPASMLNYRALTDTTPPTVPGTLTGRVNGRSITLDWADNTEPDLSEYQIFGLSGSSFSGLPNLLDNGGFEAGLTSWVPAGLGVGDLAIINTGNPQSGYAYTRLLCTSGTGGMGLSQTVSGLTSGGTYTLSGWIVVAGYTAGRARLYAFGTGITTSGILLTGNHLEWEFVSETFTLPVGTTSLTVRVWADQIPDMNVYFDGIILHAGGVPTLSKIAEARTSRFTLSVTTIDAAYYYAVTAVDRYENISTRTGAVSVLTAPVPNEEVNATPPLALTGFAVALQATNQTYQASDGATLAYATLSWANPGDTKRAYINCLYRQTGSTTWLIGDQTLATGVSSRIDDLRPLKSYDFAVQPYSQFGVGGPLTTVMAQIAPAESTPPAVPSGLTAVAQGIRTIQLDWNDNVEPDFGEYAVYQQAFPNLVVNGGFEVGLDNWSTLGTPGAGEGVAAIRASNNINGSQILRVVAASGAPVLGITQTGIAVTAGATCTVGGWLLVNPWTAGGQIVLDVTGTGLDTSGILLTTGTSAWQYVHETFTVPVGTTSVNVRLYVQNTAVGTVYADALFLHAGTPNPTAKISEVRASRFVAANIVTGLVYYFAVASIDQLENTSAKCAPVGVVSEPVTAGDVNSAPPQALLSLVVTLQGTTQTYQAADGATLAYATLAWSAPLDTLRAFTNVQYRQAGTATWLIADQTAPGAVTSRVDDLRPLKGYDFAVQPYSQFGVGGPLTIVSNQIAPAESTAPAVPSGLTATALGLRTVQLDWTDNVEPDLSEYAVYYQTFTNVLDNSGFEAGLDSWTMSGTPGAGESAVIFRATNAINGSQVLRLICNAGAGFGQIQSGIAVTSGAVYTVGAWLLMSPWTDGRVMIQVLGTGLATSGIIRTVANTAWQFVSQTFTVPIGTTSVQVRVWTDTSANGTVYADSLYLHAGTPNPTVKLSEVRASRFTASNVAASTQVYYYSIAAIDNLENMSAKCAPIGIVSEPVTSGDVNLTPPLTLTGFAVSLQGTAQTYQSSDGATLAYATLTWGNPTDTRRAFTNVLYRQNGTTTWQIADQTLATATSSRIDDLRPLSRYDLGVQPYSQFGVAGAISSVLNQVAPADGTAPATPTGLTAVAPGLRTIQLDWADNLEPDFSEYLIYQQTFTNLLDNGGFEEGLDGWVILGAPGAGESLTALRAPSAVNGSQVLRITSASGTSLGQQQTGISVTAGATYTIGGWVYLNPWTVGGEARLDVVGTGLDTGGIVITAATAGFQFVRETFTVPVGTTSVTVRAYNYIGVTGTAYWDSLFLHAGTPNPTVKISEVRASRFLANNIFAGTIYYYGVAAVDRLENISARSAITGIVSAPVTSGDVNPSAPSALTTLTSPSNGTYQSNDGTTWAFATLSWVNPSDTRRAVINVMFRKVGAVTWHVADQTTGTTGRVDDLSPGQSYDFAVQPYSQFGVGGAITTLLNQLAPGDTTAPAQVTVFTLVGQPPRGIRARWAPNTEDDLSHYELQTATDAGFTVAPVTRRVKVNEMVVGGLVNGTTYWARARAIDLTGNAGAYATAVSLAIPRAATDDHDDDSITSPKRQAVNSQSSTTLSIAAATHAHVENANATYVSGATTAVNTAAILTSTNVSFSHSVGKIPVVTTYSSNSAAITSCSLVNTTNINVTAYNHFAFALGPIVVAQYW